MVAVVVSVVFVVELEVVVVASAALAVAAPVSKMDLHDRGNFHTDPAKVADLVAEHSGSQSGLEICSRDVVVLAAAMQVAAPVALEAETAAAVVAGARCPTRPPSPTFPAFSRSREALWPSTNGHPSSACWSL